MLAEGGRNIEQVTEEESLSSAPASCSLAEMKEVASLTLQFLFLFQCMGIWKLKNYHLPTPDYSVPFLPFLFPFLIEVPAASSLVFFHSCIFSVVMVVR